MNCYQARELLSDFLSGELDDSARAGLLEHLNGCMSCRHEQELLEQSWQMLAKYEVPELGAHFTPALMNKIRAGAENPKPSLWSGFLQLPVMARAGMVFAALAIAIALPPLWKQYKGGQSAVKAPSSITYTPGVTAKSSQASDEEIIANLDFYENSDLIENLSLLSDLDAVQVSGEQKTENGV